MKLHGYDPASRCLWSWSREFTFAGRADSPPGDFVLSRDSLSDSAFGAHFLSGVKGRQHVVWKDGKTERELLVDDGLKRSPKIGAVMFGPSAGRPDEVSSFVAGHLDADSIHVCPLIDELSAFGALARNLCSCGLDRPRRANLFAKRLGPAGIDFNPAYDRLPDDCYGKMAHELLSGCVCLNEAMDGPGISPFHGRLIHLDYRPGSVMLVNEGKFPALFPNTHPLLRMAATCVPVRMELHQPDIGIDGSIDVFLASDFCRELSVFHGFLVAMGGRDYAFSSPHNSPTGNGKVLVLRYDGLGTIVGQPK